MRSIPGEWRDEILSVAAGVSRRHSPSHESTFAAPTKVWWRELLWPCPQAWAGLAAVWGVILVLNLASRDPVEAAKTSKAAPAPKLLIALREHRRLLAELIGSTTVLESPKPFEPRPRSEISHPIVSVQLV